MTKVYVITAFDVTNLSQRIVTIRSDKNVAKQQVDALNRHAAEEVEYRLTSYVVDGEECYD